MGLIQRPADFSDIEIIQRIVDDVQLYFDPNDKRLGEFEARHIVSGFFDPGITRFTKFEGDEDWQGLISLNPDSVRRRFYLDIYTRPSSLTLEENLQLAIDLAHQAASEYQLWLGVNSRDFRYKEHLESRGFEILRKYWTMELALEISPAPLLKNGVSIREIDLQNEEDRRAFWQVHQDSFSTHFGFVPRSFESWSEVMLKDAQEAKTRTWLLSSGEESLGFVECDESMSHEDAGYVSGLGVRIAQHGNGHGETLLRHAIHIYSELGFKKLILSVDAGNESGALRLYEKVGMSAISEWHQYENQDWSSLATR